MSQFNGETGGSINVLEIGYGSNPAIDEGTLFQDSRVNYIGIELPKIFKGCFKGFRRSEAGFSEVTGSMSALPFRDESFDYVLMRSVYGQFDSRPEIVTPVRCGVAEVSRILKPEGKIVVAEENTPLKQSYIYLELTSMGFVIEGQYKMPGRWENTSEYDDWRVNRSKFYAGKPMQDFGAHLTIGCKPTGLETDDHVIPSLLNFYVPDRHNAEMKVADLTFRFPKRTR